MTPPDDCHRCQRFSGYCGSGFLVCAVHPTGPVETPCPDFAEVTEPFEPLGGAYYCGELVLQPTHYLTTAERLEILETHPFFTEVCPECGEVIASHQESAGVELVHYDCTSCGFKDDLIN
jgi:predicted RNA-binding Zn-ribbon protein involved in translation (DUF1610 family)